MPAIIMSKTAKLEPSMRRKAYAFLEKLTANDAAPGLHVEPIQGSRDPRVRTGRVDDNYRAVMFKLTGSGEPAYVIHGIWPHDEANRIAERVTLTINPVNGVPEILEVLDAIREEIAETVPPPDTSASPPQPRLEAALPAPRVEESAGAAHMLPASISVEMLRDDLGINADLAAQAVGSLTPEAFSTVVNSAKVDWQGLVLIELSEGVPVDEIKETYGLTSHYVPAGNEDDHIQHAVRTTSAAQTSFAWIGKDNDELRRVIEQGDFGAWRLFLHPEQRRFARGNWGGPFRLSGGAGTGKTVVVIHRARELARRSPKARILVTTYTRNLADNLQTDLLLLDDDLPWASSLGRPGLGVAGIDSVAHQVLHRAGDLSASTEAVLGFPLKTLTHVSTDQDWQAAITSAGDELPAQLRTRAFFESEYTLVVLPNRITTQAEYLRARRPGRGVALDRRKRAAVWRVIETYRNAHRVSETASYPERVAIAAEYLRSTGPLFDHVLVDEAQDLSPVHWQLLRALVVSGRNDLFLAEDSHQRIYGDKITLSQFGIAIRGRSRRLTLNYRTTARNLDFAMRVLSGGDYQDLEGDQEKHSYRSLRVGSPPEWISCTGLSEAYDQAAALVRRWINELPEVAGQETIGLLVRNTSRRADLVSALAERDVKTRSVDREMPRPGCPLVMTMHRAKGLEFTHVLLFDIGASSIPRALNDYHSSDQDLQDALLRERSLLYVAATRARDVLAGIWTGEVSPLLEGATEADVASGAPSSRPAQPS